jgi:hypothetical protein
MTEDQQARIAAPEDLKWAIDRVNNMAAIALVNAGRLGKKILKGFGYPDEVFSDAQDARALMTVLDALASAQAAQPSPCEWRESETPGWLMPGCRFKGLPRYAVESAREYKVCPYCTAPLTLAEVPHER